MRYIFTPYSIQKLAIFRLKNQPFQPSKEQKGKTVNKKKSAEVMKTKKPLL